LFDWDIASGEVMLTGEWAQMIGAAPGETRTTLANLAASVHPDDYGKLHGAMLRLVKGRSRSYDVEHGVRGRDGKWIWIESRGEVTERDEGGRALRAIGTNRCISERKTAEQTLKLSEEKFAKAFRSSPEFIAISTLAEGRYIDVNEAFE